MPARARADVPVLYPTGSPTSENEALVRAEARLAAGTYGRSIESCNPIPDERLEARPTGERTVRESVETVRLLTPWLPDFIRPEPRA